MSQDPENEYFSDGLTEEIINALTKVVGLKVTARTSSFAFKNQNKDIRSIGQELNVANILEGSVRMAQDRVRITAQLINVADGFHFWSETFDRDLNDIFKVQDEISLLIADKLREETGHFPIGDQLVDAPDIPLATYQHFLKGKYLIQKMNKIDVEAGIEIMKELTVSNPSFPLPYLKLHKGYSFLGTVGVMPTEEAFAQGSAFLGKAIQLNPGLAECQFHIAGNSFWKNWDLDETYRYLNRALEIQPSFAEAYQFMSFLLAMERKFKAAMTQIDKALQLDPLAATNHYYKACFFYFQEQFEEAIPHFEKSFAIEPRFIFGRIVLISNLMLMGRMEEGLKLCRELPKEGVINLSQLGLETLASALLGDKKATELGIGKLEAAMKTPAMERALFFLILTHTRIGNHEKALELIKLGIDQQVPLMIAMHVEPHMKPLYVNPTFKEIMRGIVGRTPLQNLPEKKYKKSPLKAAQAKEYFKQLELFMDQQQPFLNPQLSLRQLAKMIELHPNYLSQLLNEQSGQNFSEFINGYRLETFKVMAQDPKNHHLTLLGLAFESGFSSKTVFNTFFKRKMGITPSQYWKNLPSQSK